MRSSTICAATTSEARVRECCCDLKATVTDLSDAIRSASVLFFRLTGRQTKYAGECTHTVRPWIPSSCSCSCKPCCCELDHVRLPGACEIVQVVVDGVILDPNTYALDGDRLVERYGYEWPKCQSMGNNSSPLSVFTQSVSTPYVTPVTLSAQADGTITVTGLPANSADSIVLVDSLGVEYAFPTARVAGTVFSTTAGAIDWEKEQVFNVVKLVKDKQPFNAVTTIVPVSYHYRTYITRPLYSGSDHPENTFQVTYRTGCNISEEIQIAVAVLACELAKARCGDNTCRLPRHMQSFSRDGERFFEGPGAPGLTGIPEVDKVILSINPKGLSKNGRLLKPSRTRYSRYR